MMNNEKKNRGLMEAFGIDPEAMTKELIEMMENDFGGSAETIIDTIVEAGKEILPSGISDQYWIGFVTGYYTGFAEGTCADDEEDEES